jgi:hypothetical protein
MFDQFAPDYTQQSTTFYTYGTTGGFWGGGFGGAGCVDTICYISNVIIFTINSVLVPLIFAIAFIVFLYGIAKAYIFSQGDLEAVSKGHKLILWGLIGFAVMISIWGLVNIVANTFGLGGQYVPNAPYTPGTRNIPTNLGNPAPTSGGGSNIPAYPAPYPGVI